MDLNAYVEKSYGGVHALMLTPFKEDLSVDYDIYPEYVRWQIAQGAHYLFAVCGSSEMGKLTLEERVKLAALTAKHREGAVKVFATGNLEPTWHAQLDEIKRMEDTGVDGLVFVTKGYADDEERQITYLKELIEHTALPVILYEYPGFKPAQISAYVYGELVKTGRVFGIKDTTCTMRQISEKIAVQGETCVLQANIPLLLEAYKAGARGTMSTPTTCGTKIFRRMWDAFVAGDMKEATEQHANICLLDGALDGGFTATAKFLVAQQGVPMNWFTRNGHVLSESKQAALRTFYEWAARHGVL
ncbi:MAG: dihydrodipicolinate synthase family protein [Oscillospiraceae bacterium]|nr:dihydrodipicolinate synthase family protein [Oscillospiraceae bacterium]